MTLQEYNFLNTNIAERTVLNLYLLINIRGKKLVRTANTVYCSRGSDIFEGSFCSHMQEFPFFSGFL